MAKTKWSKKSKYIDIYSLIQNNWFTSDYVRELYQFDPIRLTIKIVKGNVSKRVYSVSIVWLWIAVKEYIDQQLKAEQA